MKAERDAIHAAIVGDALTSPIVAGSTTEWIALGASEAAKWAPDDPVTLAAGHGGLVWTVREVDLVGDRIRVAPALASPPAAGGAVGGGMTTWLRTDLAWSGVYWLKPKDAPPEELLNAEGTDPRVIAWWSMGEAEGFLWSDTRTWEIHVLGMNVLWAEAAATRLSKLLDGLEGLSVPGRDVMGLWVSQRPVHVPRGLQDPLLELQLELSTRTAVEV